MEKPDTECAALTTEGVLRTTKGAAPTTEGVLPATPGRKSPTGRCRAAPIAWDEKEKSSRRPNLREPAAMERWDFYSIP